MSTERTVIKMHCIQTVFVIGPENIPFAGVYYCDVSTFQHGNCTGWGNERVKRTLAAYGHYLRWKRSNDSRLLAFPINSVISRTGQTTHTHTYK